MCTIGTELVCIIWNMDVPHLREHSSIQITNLCQFNEISAYRISVERGGVYYTLLLSNRHLYLFTESNIEDMLGTLGTENIEVYLPSWYNIYLPIIRGSKQVLVPVA